MTQGAQGDVVAWAGLLGCVLGRIADDMERERSMRASLEVAAVVSRGMRDALARRVAELRGEEGPR